METPINQIPATPPDNKLKLLLAKINRKLVLLISSLLLITIILIVVARSPRTNPNQTVEITYWGLWDSIEVMAPIITDFQTLNPHIIVKYIQQKPQDYRERLSSAIANGQGPDVFRFHQSWMPMLFQNLDPMPASVFTPQEFEQTFYPIAVSSLTFNQKTYGLPLEIDGLGLYYNKNIFTTSGKSPPQTWNELRTIAEDLTLYQGKTIQRGGMAMGLTTNVDHWPEIIGVLMMQAGGHPKTPNSLAGQEAFTYFTQFVTKDKVWDATLPPSTYAFATEKVAMMIAPTWRAHEIHAQNPNLNFAIVPIPQLIGTKVDWGGFWVEGVNATINPNHKQASWTFLKYLSQKDTLQKFYTQASSQRLFGKPFSRVDMSGQLVSDSYVGAIIQSANSMRSWYLNSHTFDNGLNDRMINLYQETLLQLDGNSSVTDLLPILENNIKQLLINYSLE